MTTQTITAVVRFLWTCFSVGASIFFTGCQKHVTTDDLQGTWIPNKDSLRWVKVTNICIIILQTNGTFTGSVPDYLMKTSDQCSGQVMTGVGKWSLFTKPLQTFVKLNFTEVDGKQIFWGANELEVQTGSGRTELFFYVGEEGGDRFVFVRPTK